MKVNKIAQRILVISDLHAKYYHPDTIKFLQALKKKYNPTDVVLTGDEVEYSAISYHESHPEMPGAGQELEEAIEALTPIYKMFPNAYILESNHGSLVLRKGKTAGLPSKVFKSYNEILDAPKGWKWVPTLTMNTAKGPIFFTHGTTSTVGRLSSLYGMSCIQGHFHHTAHIQYTSTPERLLFDVVVGCLIDDKALAFTYNKLIAKRPIIGCAVVIDGTPQLIPMFLDSNGRWINKL